MAGTCTVYIIACKTMNSSIGHLQFHKIKLIQHKQIPDLLKLLAHVCLVSINTSGKNSGKTTSFKFQIKSSIPQLASFTLCQWFAFTSKILYNQPYLWARWASNPMQSNQQQLMRRPETRSRFQGCHPWGPWGPPWGFLRNISWLFSSFRFLDFSL